MGGLIATCRQAKRTARIRVNLPVVVEGSATNKDGQDGSEEGSQDEGEANVDANPVGTSKTVLCNVSIFHVIVTRARAGHGMGDEQ